VVPTRNAAMTSERYTAVEIGTIPEDFQDIMDGKQLPQI
jgi:hypothetical protein